MRPLLLALLLPAAALASFSCKDQHNSDVPWFAAYKMPKMAGEAPGSAQGHGYYYLDSADRSKLRVSVVSIDQDHQAIGYTMAQYYSNKGKANLLHVFYNDEPAVGVELMKELDNRISADDLKAIETGHTKGVVLFDGPTGTGVWLIHSVPKFPSEAKYGYPDSGTEYAQSFLCLTLSVDQLKTLGTALFYNHPDVYSKSNPSWVAGKSADLEQVLNGKYNTDSSKPSFHSTISVTGSQSNAPKMEVFAKNHLFEKDLWQGLVAPTLGGPMEVESWRRGSTINIDCHSADTIYDAKTMKVGGTAEFSYTKDHSKHGRTMKAASGRVCIGDINRMTTQFKRGGGAVCIEDPAMWKAWAVYSSLPTC